MHLCKTWGLDINIKKTKSIVLTQLGESIKLILNMIINQLKREGHIST